MGSSKATAWSWRHHREYWRDYLKAMESRRPDSTDEFDNRVSMIVETGSIFKEHRQPISHRSEPLFKVDLNNKIFRRCLVIGSFAFMAVTCLVNETSGNGARSSVKRDAMTGTASNQNKITRDYTDEEHLSKLYMHVFSLEPWCHWSPEKGACSCAYCTCDHPLIPKKRHDDSVSTKIRRQNSGITDLYPGNPDVLFLGDSPMEWTGGSADGQSRQWEKYMETLFKSSFAFDTLDSVDLGISGDTATNLLWRIEKDDILENLIPKVIWLSIGANDFGIAGCSKEIVLIGILRVIEELRRRRPDSILVINGILPSNYGEDGFVNANGKKFFSDTAHVNEQLKIFSEKHYNVEYFDANKIFIEDLSRNEYDLRLEKDFMRSRFQHPNARGYQMWAKGILETLEKIFPLAERI